MQWLDRLNDALDYVEAQLSGKIDSEKAARIACCSEYHFIRMFSYIAGVPLSEYVRRRRMTLAAFDLQNTHLKVIDIAAKYGYESPTSFARAFSSVHGVSPSAARAQGSALKAYSRMRFQITIKGDVQMNYRFEQRDAFRIVGVSEHMKLNIEENFKRTPQIWAECFQSGMFEKICALDEGKTGLVLGVSTCMNKDFDYYIAVQTDKDVPEGMSEYTVPAATWAVFECIGPMPAAIQTLQKQIVTDWLPSSGYEYADGPDIEAYTAGDTQSPDYRSEVWLPVVKKDSK